MKRHMEKICRKLSMKLFEQKIEIKCIEFFLRSQLMKKMTKELPMIKMNLWQWNSLAAGGDLIQTTFNLFILLSKNFE